MSDSPNSPLAPRRPTVLEKHGERRIRIDPALSGAASLLFGSFAGGNRGDEALDIEFDGAGSMWLTGYAESSNGWDAVGGISTYYHDNRDAFILKIRNNVVARRGLFGAGSCETAYGISLDSGGWYITGHTGSPDMHAEFQLVAGGGPLAGISTISNGGSIGAYASCPCNQSGCVHVSEPDLKCIPMGDDAFVLRLPY